MCYFAKISAFARLRPKSEPLQRQNRFVQIVTIRSQLTYDLAYIHSQVL